jgi:predicted transposase/invertase (TIGR01784 family)
LDKWLYFIKHLEDFQTIPTIFKDEVFIQAFEKAELAKFNQTELESYENSLKIYRDLKGVIDTAFDEGKLEGRLEGRLERDIEIAKALKETGVSTDIISKTTGLSEDEINKL